MFELAHFTLSDMVRCSNGVREVAAGASSMEAAAQSIVTFFQQNLVDKELDERSCALARFYKTHPFDQLEPALQARARALAPDEPTWADVPCLTLLGTAGDEPEWGDRRTSAAHAAIPLYSTEAVCRLPMIQQLVEQLGLDVDEIVAPHPELFVDLDQRSYNVFHVADAMGSPYVPAQDEFVIRHGVRSVLGFGGVLPSGSMFAVILFSRTPIDHGTAELFRSVALAVKLAVLPFVDGPVFDTDAASTRGQEEDLAALRSRAAAAEQLVAVHGNAVLAQALRLESTLENAERRAADLAASERALVDSEARARAVIDVSLDAIVGMDGHGRITEFNPAAEAVFGYSKNEVVGRLLAEVIIPESLRQRHFHGLEEYLRTGRGPVLGRRIELTGLRANGEEFPVELAVTTVGSPEGAIFTAFLRDITKRKASEAALRQSRERAMRIARTLQDSLLPPTPPRLPGLELASRYHPAGDGSEVGGDFYDVFQNGRDDWGIVLGDVCGKGTEAAALTALARYSIRATAIRSRRPGSILRTLNEVVHAQYPERFCTVLYSRLRRQGDNWQLTVASGGHPPCLLVRSTGELVELGEPGIIVGPFPSASFPEVTDELLAGDLLVFYTDGVTEARGAGGTFYGEWRLKDLLRSMAGRAAADVARAVEAAVLDFQGGFASDDLAVLVVRWPGKPVAQVRHGDVGDALVEGVMLDPDGKFSFIEADGDQHQPEE
ncbi:MAG: PP2C family protein-serine/threonine phosphatase [Acidimicrobiales bacterium]